MADSLYIEVFELAVRLEKIIEEISQQLIDNVDQDSSWMVPG
jgi:hypothetical protein